MLLAVTGAAAGIGTAQAAPALDPSTDRPTSSRTLGDAVLVRFAGAPLATSNKVDRRSNDKVVMTGSKTRSVSADLAAQRNQFKSWLRSNAPAAKVTSEYDFVLNAVAVKLNGTSASLLRSAPGVAQVTPQATYHPTAHEDPDLALIDGPAGWSAAGASSADGEPSTWAGYGVQVGVIDTGIDTEHPCFDDAGFPATKQVGDPDLTNNKVIAARVFYNQLNRSGYDATAVQDHGTHVAGTVGCNLHTPAVVEGADIPYDPSGVAPGAQLGSYNVFPGDVDNARSEDILNAMQSAARDGMDVINMSLGGASSGKQDLMTMAADNLDRAGIVMAISAGNEGPGEATTGSPGMAERALTAGASTVGHYVGVPITSGGSRVTVAATGDFPVPTTDLTAPLDAVTAADGTLSQACAALPGGSLAGEIALVSRGTCTFTEKVANAAAAGAVAVVVVNNIPGDPTAMGGEGTIPAVMAPLDAKQALMALDGQAVTIGSQPAYRDSNFDDVLASFSSRGPVDVTARVKPDVVAPGVNVLSSIPLSFCEDATWFDPNVGCWAFFQGTSMASPHLAGMAAVVLDAHPAWESWQVRSAIVNTADQDGVMQTLDPSKVETNVQYVGAGLADLDAAVTAKVALSRPSISFGAVPSGSGQTSTQTLTVTNLSGTALTLPVTVEDSTGDGTFSATPSTLQLAAGETRTVTVSLALPKGAAAGHTQAFLELGNVAHAPLYAFVK
jgi:subtilisin family serine protease